MDQIQVTAIGTGDGMPMNGTSVVAETPHGTPNVVVEFVRPIVALSVRFGFTFGTILVSMLSVAMTPYGQKLLPITDFTELVKSCAIFALSGASFELIKNIVTIFGKLEAKYPLWTGSV